MFIHVMIVFGVNVLKAAARDGREICEKIKRRKEKKEGATVKMKPGENQIE